MNEMKKNTAVNPTDILANILHRKMQRQSAPICFPMHWQRYFSLLTRCSDLTFWMM